MAATCSKIAFSWSRVSATSNEENGIVEIFGCVDLDSQLRVGYCPPKENLHAQAAEPHSSTDVVCLLSVPAAMIPTELLHFFRAYLSSFLCVRVFRHLAHADKYLTLIQLTSAKAAEAFIGDYSGTLLSSLDNAYCVLHPVHRVVCCGGSGQLETVFSTQPGASTAAAGDSTENRRLLSLIPCTPSLYLPASPSACVRSGKASLVSALTLGQSQPDPVARAESSLSASRDQTFLNLIQSDSQCQELCVLCLERLSSKGVVTTFCSHTFHIDCILHLNGPQCPVCR
jgi:hypothetical protein